MNDLSRRALRGLLAALLAVLVGACYEKPVLPLRVGVSEWPGYAPLIDAREAGELPRARFRVLAFESIHHAVRNLRNGVLDAGALTLDVALQLMAEDPRFRVVLVFDDSLGGDALLARPGIAGIAGLRGRKVMVDTQGYSSLLLAEALSRAGLAPADLVYVRLPRAEREQAFRAGAADAIVSEEPARSRLLAGGAVELFSSRAAPGLIVDVLVAREDVIATRCAELRELIAAWAHFVPWERGEELGLRFVPLAESRSLLGKDNGIGKTVVRLRALLGARVAKAPDPVGTDACLPVAN